MANAYINLYTGNPTAAGTDGTAVSTGDTEASPVSVTLNASNAETAIIKCALRCESGYKTSGNTVITFTGSSTPSGRWPQTTTMPMRRLQRRQPLPPR